LPARRPLRTGRALAGRRTLGAGRTLPARGTLAAARRTLRIAGLLRLLGDARDAAAAAHEVLQALLGLEQAGARQHQHHVALREAIGDLDAAVSALTTSSQISDFKKRRAEWASRRASARAFAPDPLPAQTLSNLLWAAWGINRPQEGKRTAPSARNWQERDLT
jgi:hypothetical protein